jgi:hypothetical protein
MSWKWVEDGVGNPNAPPGGPPPVAPNPGMPGLHNQDFKGVLGQRGGNASPGLAGLQQRSLAAPAAPSSPYAHLLGQMPAGVDMLRPVAQAAPPPVAPAAPLAPPAPVQPTPPLGQPAPYGKPMQPVTSDVRTKTNITPMSWEDYLRSRN